MIDIDKACAYFEAEKNCTKTSCAKCTKKYGLDVTGCPTSDFANQLEEIYKVLLEIKNEKCSNISKNNIVDAFKANIGG